MQPTGSVSNKTFESERLEDTSLTNEAEGQTTTNASRTKLFESGRDSETSATRESSADVDLEISSFKRNGFTKMSEERRSLNLSKIVQMPPTKSSKWKKLRQSSYKPV